MEFWGWRKEGVANALWSTYSAPAPPALGWDEESQGVEGEAPFFTSLPHLSWPVALGLSAGA